MTEHLSLKWMKHYDFLLLDTVCACLSFLLSHKIRFPESAFFGIENEYSGLFYFFIFTIFLVDIGFNIFSGVLKRGYLKEFFQIIKTSVASLAFVSLFMYLTHIAGGISRLLVIISFLLFMVLGYVGRILLKKTVASRLRHEVENPNTGRAVFLLTDTGYADEIISNIKADYLRHLSIKAMMFSDGAFSDNEYDGIKVINDLDSALSFICHQWIDDVFIYLPENAAQPKQFIDSCTEMGVTIHSVLNIRAVDTNKQFIENYGEHTVLTTAFTYADPYKLIIKRTVDILGGIVGSVFTILLGLIVGPLIYINSPGPIFFKQLRIGQNGKKFYMYKFRSMYPDAEEKKKEYLSQNRNTDGMMFKLDFDPRIIGNKVLPDGTRKTGLGEFIRKTSIDEFPQFFNVLIGNMSLVGTRPPTVDEWEKYKYHHRARLAMKPGITGLWQISGRSQITDFEEVVKLDTDYISNFSLGNDLKILLKTVIVVLKRKGSM